METEIKKPNYLIIIVPAAIIFLFFLIYLYKIIFISPASPESPKPEAIINLKETVYRHNGLVFEPIEFTVTNQGSKSFYYLHGCAVSLPEIEQKNESGFTPLPEDNDCQTLPLAEQLLPGESFTLNWDQKVGNELVEPGVYRLGFKYSYDKPESSLPIKSFKWNTVYSSPLVIKEIEKNLETTKNLCQEIKGQFKINGGYYSANWCETVIKEAFGL